MNRINAVWSRAWKTLVQSAIGAAAGAMLSVIGSSQTIGQVDWQLVASTACLAAIVSVLMNIKANLPELDAQAVEMEFFEDEDQNEQGGE